jgi:hypothetical protein
MHVLVFFARVAGDGARDAQPCSKLGAARVPNTLWEDRSQLAEDGVERRL